MLLLWKVNNYMLWRGIWQECISPWCECLLLYCFDVKLFSIIEWKKRGEEVQLKSYVRRYRSNDPYIFLYYNRCIPRNYTSGRPKVDTNIFHIWNSYIVVVLLEEIFSGITEDIFTNTYEEVEKYKHDQLKDIFFEDFTVD